MDHIFIGRGIVEELSETPVEVIKVLLVLCERSQLQQELKLGLTEAELARTAGVASTAIEWVFEWMLSRTEPWMTKQKKGKTCVLLVSDRFVPDPYAIPYTNDNTDETKIAKVESEMRRLVRQQQQQERSGLTDIYKGEEGDLYNEIEKRRGYAINVFEAILLGKMLSKFGVERVKKTLRQMQKARDPIRATYAALQKGIKGQGAKELDSEPLRRVTYRDVD